MRRWNESIVRLSYNRGRRGSTVLLLASCFLLLTQCAKQVTPGGGPRDTEPPKAVRTVTENFSTSIYPTTVTITFDEYIELNDAQTQVFMSPAGSSKPVVRLRNKTLEIDMPDTLRLHTTYTLYFGNAIRDLNEGNVLRNFQFVFSTGTFIDSLRLQGFVYNALDNKPYANALVMLRRDASDSAIVKTLPDYFTRSDEQGFFRMDYLRSDTFRLTAVDDANNNFRYDGIEAVGFRDTLVAVKDTSQTVRLHLFKAEAARSRVLSARHTAATNRVTVAFTKPTENLQAALLAPVEAPLPYTYNFYRDTLTLYAPPLTGDTIRFRLQQTGMDTTLSLRMLPVTARDTTRRKQTAASEPASNLARTSRDFILPFGYPFRVTFPVPLASFDSTRMALALRSDTTVRLPFAGSLFVDTFFHRSVLQLEHPFRQDSVYVLRLLDSAAVDVQRRNTKAQRFEFRYGTRDESGSLIVNVKEMDSTRQHLLLLRSNALAYQRTWILNGKEADVKVADLVPGAYTLQLVFDDNRNNRRDSGNYWQGKQPETTINYTGGVTVRANWDTEVTLQAVSGATTGSGIGGKGIKGK